ncbi:MAG: hypothetical protein DRO18_04155 [Thermoprotei archaeon]|nr:MAG: hypothetical protein DRO18_04155 [Thermoprotei archaeon]
MLRSASIGFKLGPVKRGPRTPSVGESRHGPSSYEDIQRELERRRELGYRFVGVQAIKADSGEEWLDHELKPLPRELQEMTIALRKLKRRMRELGCVDESRKEVSEGRFSGITQPVS